MQPSASDAACVAAAAQRLLLAVGCSAALHAAVIWAVRAGPSSLPSRPAPPIEAVIVENGAVRDEASLQSPPQIAAGAGEAEQAGPSDPVAPQPQAQSASEPESASASTTKASARATEPAGSAPAHMTLAGPDVPFAPDLNYYSIAELDHPPAPLAPPDACYPHGASGEVTYELLIDETGTVTQAAVVAVEPKNLFTAAAAELCSALKFSPAIKGGRSVRSRVRFVVGPA